MTLLDATGHPIVTPPPKVERCPRCDKGPEARTKHTAMGGHWRVLCSCGHEFERGRNTEENVR